MQRPGFGSLNAFFRAWTALVLCFLYIPIVAVVAFSFNRSRLNIDWEGFTFEWYRALLDDRPILDAAMNTLIVAGVTTVISVILGTAGAWLLHQYRYRFRGVIGMLVLVPVVMPEIIMGISLLIFFASVNNVGNRLLAWLGVDDAPLGLGYTTLIIAHVTFCFPFVLIPVRARLAGIDPALMEAAMDLGATPARAFWRVMLPNLVPAIVSGALMAFTLSVDELIITYFTTGPNSGTLPLKIFGMAKVGINPSINAISTVLIVLTAVIVVCGQYLWMSTRGGGKRMIS
jgi:spermidine/putrescine transport system permease protein